MRETYIEELMELLRQEIKRTRSIIDTYELVSPSGMFFVSNIQHEIAIAEDAIASGDIEGMIISHIHLIGIE